MQCDVLTLRVFNMWVFPYALAALALRVKGSPEE